MHFSIFIPREVGADPKKLNAVGLGHLLRAGDTGPLMQELPDRGPDGGPGLLFVWPPSLPAYQPEGQKWQPAKIDPAAKLPAGRFWWGYDVNQPPTATDLARGEMLRGSILKIQDQYWQVPNILALPHDFILGDDGHFKRDVAVEYSAIYRRGLWAYDLLERQIKREAPAPVPEMCEYVIEMLGHNYRVFRELVSELRLLSDSRWFQFACNTVDIETLMQIEYELQKKRAATIRPT